jgi:hypothetical protein
LDAFVQLIHSVHGDGQFFYTRDLIGDGVHNGITVDSMGFREGDVSALLGGLRYRLVPKLEAVGLTLFWHVDDLPLWPNGQIYKLRHL